MHQRADDIGYENKYEFLKRIKDSEVLFPQGLLGIQGSFHALKEITESKYQAGYEEVGGHGHLVIKITIKGRRSLQMC